MPQGLWTIAFHLGDHGSRTAVVTLCEHNKVHGGNDNFYYIGDYQFKEGVITATLNSTQYNGAPDPVMGGLTEMTMTIAGRINDNQIRGLVKIEELNTTFAFIGSRRDLKQTDD